MNENRSVTSARQAPVCSVIVPVYNYAALTRQCLHFLLEGRESVPFEIVVVDDCSQDDTPQMLEAFSGRITMIRHERNMGFGHACNDGAAAASGQYLVFLNSDTVPHPGWLDALVRHADQHERAAAVGSKLLYPDGTVQHAGVAIAQDHCPRHLYAGFPGDHPAVNKSRRFPIVTAGCALIRADAFRAADGFDTAFVNGFEDVDLCLRLGEAGYEVRYCHESVLDHLESISRRDRGDEDRRNFELYWERWSRKVVPDDFLYYQEDGLISVRYNRLYPAAFRVAPELAFVEPGHGDGDADRHIDARAQQFLDLLRENVALNVRLRAVELAAQMAPRATERLPLVPPPDGSTRDATPALEVAHEGWSAGIDRLDDGAISVVMPLAGNPGRLDATIERLVGAWPGALELLVVDVGLSGAAREKLERHRAWRFTVDSSTAPDLVKAVGLAAEQARAEFVALVDPRYLVDPRWLIRLVDRLRREPGAAAVAGRPLAEHGPGTFTERMPDAWTREHVFVVEDWWRIRDHGMSPFEPPPFQLKAAVVRSQVIRKIPLPATAAGGPLAWARDVLEAGWRLVYDPQAVARRRDAVTFQDIATEALLEGRAEYAARGKPLPAERLLPDVLVELQAEWSSLRKRYVDDPAALEVAQMEVAIERSAAAMGRFLAALESTSFDVHNLATRLVTSQLV